MRAGAQPTWWRPPAAAPASSVADAVPRAGSTPFWALMGFTLVLLLSPQSFVPVLGQLHLAFLCAALAGGTYVLGQFLRRQPVLRFTPEMTLTLCLVAWVLLTLPMSYWPGGSLDYFFDIFLKAVIVFWLLANVVDSTERLRTAAWILSLIAIPLSVSAVRGFFSGGFRSEELSGGMDRIMGYDAALTVNPNDLALMLNLILPLSAALLFITRRPALRYLLASAIGLDVIAIIATFSRAGFLTLGVIGLCYLAVLLRRRRHSLILFLACGALAGAVLLPSAYLDRLGTITNIQADSTGSAQARLGDSLAAVSYVASHPFVGAGINMNILALNEARGATWTKVHDVYLEYAVDLGLPGLLLFLLLLRRVVRGVTRARDATARDPAQAELHALAEGLGISLTGFMVAAFFYPDAYQFYFYYIAGLAVAAATIAPRTRPESIPA